MDKVTPLPACSPMNNDPGVRLSRPSDIMLVRLSPDQPKYKDIPMAERKQWLAAELTKLALLKHQRPDPEILPFDVQALDDFILDEKYAADLTKPEIDWAFMRGIRGCYGEYFGLTADALYGFIDGYLKSPEKRESARLMRIAKGVEKPESEGAVDYLRKIREHNARVLAARMQEWKKEQENQ